MKINGIETSAKQFAYDGCHKIYLIEDGDDYQEARDSGYDIIPIASLRHKFNESCGLQFISNWKATERFVNQFQEACFEF